MAYYHISLSQPIAQGDPGGWLRMFEICCKANVWDSAAKAAESPTLLDEEALAVWLELGEVEQGFIQLVSAAGERLPVAGHVSAAV